MNQQIIEAIQKCSEHEMNSKSCEELLSQCERETDCPTELKEDTESCVSAQRQLKTRCEKVLEQIETEKEEKE